MNSFTRNKAVRKLPVRGAGDLWAEVDDAISKSPQKGGTDSIHECRHIEASVDRHRFETNKSINECLKFISQVLILLNDRRMRPPAAPFSIQSVGGGNLNGGHVP